MADHIFNLSAIKDRMQDPPKAQRLYELINDGNVDAVSAEQIEDIIDIMNLEINRIKEIIG